MKEVILSRLKKFEADNGVEVILAVESGSWGWGFASADSDYDVRFVYKYPIERYLDLQPPSDSHDWIEGEVDYEGYDAHKFYDLLYKSNMNLIDWLMQDVIYIDKLRSKDELKKAVSEYFDRSIYVKHNFGLCNKNYSDYFNSKRLNEPTAKRYVYIIRALLSAEYCMKYSELAPLKFDTLIKRMLTESEIREINEMLEIKKKSREKMAYHNGKWLHWIEDRMRAKLDVKGQTPENKKTYYDILNSHMKMQLR